jgi:hypothetical protein
MTNLTHEQLAEIIENSEYAAGASLGYDMNNYNSNIKKVDLTERIELPIVHDHDVRSARQEAINNHKDDKYWKMYADKKNTARGRHDAYYGAIGKLIKDAVGVSETTEVAGLMLEGASNGKFNEIVAGQYNYITHTVEVAKIPTEKEIAEAVDSGLTAQFLKLYEVTPENADTKVNIYQQFMDANKARTLQHVLASVESVKGSHAVTHELIHAGALNYMRNNPKAEATVRINELYKEALKNKDKITRLTYGGDVFSTYWQTNVEEFLAEAMSNPGLMYALSQTKTDGKKKLSKGMLRELVDTMLDMLGLSPKVKDNVLEYVMDGFAAIIEAQADKVPVVLELDSETKAMLRAKLNELKEQKGTIHLEDRAASEKADIERLKDC